MKGSSRNRCRGIRQGWLCLLAAFVGVSNVTGQELTEEQFVASSLRDRTALHYDPLLDAPLDSLIKLYRGAERVDELIGLYKSHVAQFPEDAGAKTVLIRLLRRIDRAGAAEMIAAVIPLHPDFAPLQFVLFRFLEERGDARATEALSRAIDLETNPARRNEWLDQLLQLSEGESARTLAELQFNKLLALENQAVESLLALARLMQRYQFWDLSIAALNKAKAARPDPEAGVEVDLMLATAQSQLGNRADAGRMLDALLKRLSADHWRRREILSLRVSVLATDAEREAMLAMREDAYKKNPRVDASVLDYIDLLAASEKRTEAVKVALAALAESPNSRLIESRGLELLESSPDPAAYADFLEQRLEVSPDRSDLRFRLVKAYYALGQDADAEQDFKTLVAGLPPEEVSTRLLELQRYLRSIDRIDAAAPSLESYVRSHPTRLDVARELTEIYADGRATGAIDALVRALSASEAEVSEVIDLAEFLVSRDFLQPARVLVTAKLAIEPKQFELGLLLVDILGKMGESSAAEQQIALSRELADTSPRYARWLEVTVASHRRLETLTGFFDSEQNRFSFAEGEWPEDRIEKFLILCEVGKQQLFNDRVARGIRERLAQTGISAQLSMRLRNFLVGVLETVPEAAGEVEEQLKLLATEDPANRLEYDLRRALVYHRSQRVDLAQILVAGIDLTEITSAPLLREAVDILIGYGFLKEAESALGAINRLEPRDLLSWEKRLLVLVTLRQESTFRSVIRSLRGGDAGITLRKLSNLSLDEHLSGSYWRSISSLMASGEIELEEVLPLLASAEREDLTTGSRLWAEWTRALVLTRLGRDAEAAEAIARFREYATFHKIAAVNFPDGLVLSVDAASDFLTPRTTPEAAAGVSSAAFLLDQPDLRWAFELPGDGKIVFVGRTGTAVVVFDDGGSVHVIDTVTGKLAWREHYGEGAGEGSLRRPAAFDEVPVPGYLSRSLDEEEKSGKAARSFALATDRFFLVRGNEFCAFAVADGSLLWSAALTAPSAAKEIPASGASRPSVTFVVEGEKAVVFSPETQVLTCFETASGKLLWTTKIGEEIQGEPGGMFSLNTGLTLREGHVFVYGLDSAILEAASGKIVWSFSGDESAVFPLVLREAREEELVTEVVSAKIPPTPGPQTPTADPALFDFQAGGDSGALNPTAFLSAPSALVGPGVFWAKERLWREEASYAEISEGYLMLMQSGKVRRISTRLPLASRELPASGSFIGQSGNHAWYLDGEYLHHVDFYRERASRLDVRDLGEPAAVRGTLVGNQLVVRGSRSLKVINARTGQVIGQGNLPDDLIDYLSQSGFDGAQTVAAPAVWQGRIYREGRGYPGYCLPVTDLVSGNRYFTTFGNRLLVCLEAPAGAGVTPAIPPAPVAPAAAAATLPN